MMKRSKENSSNNSVVSPRELTDQTIYPWRWTEWFLPSHWQEYRLLKSYQNGRKGLIENVEKRETPRCRALKAQLLVKKYQQEKDPALLRQAIEEIDQAIEKRPDYPPLLFKAGLLLLLNEEEEAKKILGQLNDHKDHGKQQKGKKLVKRGLAHIKKRDWSKAEKTFRKAQRALRHHWHAEKLLDASRKFEKIEEVNYILNRTRIVNIGRSRIRYYELMVRLIDELQTVINEEYLDEETKSILKNTLSKEKDMVGTALQKEIESYTREDAYLNRLKEARHHLLEL